MRVSLSLSLSLSLFLLLDGQLPLPKGTKKKEEGEESPRD